MPSATMRDNAHVTLAPSGPQEVNDRHDNGRNDDPEKLEPVEERHPNELRVNTVVKRWIQQRNKRDDQKDEKPGSPSSLRLGTGNHTRCSFRGWCEIKTTRKKENDRVWDT